MLSDDKISHLSHILLRGLIEKKLVILKGDEPSARKAIKKAISTEVKLGEHLDVSVRKKLQSYSRKIVEGSPEWDILYRKFYQEEEMKRGRAEGQL
ncbi:MAG: DUF507 family protein [Nitrospiraceae bacterium]|nr:DUF507 family protein [Nitrospiraceae bacterium]